MTTGTITAIRTDSVEIGMYINDLYPQHHINDYILRSLNDTESYIIQFCQKYQYI